MEFISLPRLIAGLGVLAISLVIWHFWQPTGTWLLPARQTPSISAAVVSAPSSPPTPVQPEPVQQVPEGLRTTSRRVVLQIERSLRAIDRVLEETSPF